MTKPWDQKEIGGLQGTDTENITNKHVENRPQISRRASVPDEVELGPTYYVISSLGVCRTIHNINPFETHSTSN
jgi:hypothetical protein